MARALCFCEQGGLARARNALRADFRGWANLHPMSQGVGRGWKNPLGPRILNGRKKRRRGAMAVRFPSRRGQKGSLGLHGQWIIVFGICDEEPPAQEAQDDADAVW